MPDFFPQPILAAVALAVGYLGGAVPFAVLIARHHGVDIFKAGSGNPGATNVKRVVGGAAGRLCFALDAMKGLMAAGWPWLWPDPMGHETRLWLAVLGLSGAIVGHSYSVFIGWRGGKGVATTIGGMAAIDPLALAVALVAWVGVFYSTGYVSLASICLALALPLASWLTGSSPVAVGFCLLLGCVIIVRHRSNLARLRAGTESRFGPRGPTG